MRPALLALVILAAAGCGGRAAPYGGLEEETGDGGPARDASPGAFCTGSGPRMEINGVAATVVAQGRMLYLNCCEAAEVALTATDGSGSRLILSWRHQVGPSPGLPATIDLSAPPDGWGVELYAGCSPSEGCPHPADTIDASEGILGGTLTIAGDFSQYQMSVCLEAADDPQHPHPILHRARFFASNVLAATPTP
jgi:hypothetical protein